MVIHILENVKTASTYEDGEVIFNLISNALSNNEDVTLSFVGITSVPSAFINSALIRLLEVFNYDFIRAKLTIVDTTKHINELIKSRFSFVLTKRGV